MEERYDRYGLECVFEFLRCAELGAVLLMVGRSYVGNDVTHSTLLDRACACSYRNLPKYRSYRVSNTAPSNFTDQNNINSVRLPCDRMHESRNAASSRHVTSTRVF